MQARFLGWCSLVALEVSNTRYGRDKVASYRLPPRPSRHKEFTRMMESNRMALHRRAIIGGVGAGISGLAGCLSSSEPEPTSESTPAEESSIAEQFDCAAAGRPEPDVAAGVELEIERENGETVTYESVGSTDYPEPPNSGEKEIVGEFLREYETAYHRNYFAEIYGEEFVRYGIEFDETEFVDGKDHLSIAVLSSEVTMETLDVAGHWPVWAAYAIDGTGLVRRDHLGPDERDQPEVLTEGQLHSCF